MDSTVLEGIGLIGMLSPVPLTRLVEGWVGLLATVMPQPVCPRADLADEALARAARVFIRELTQSYFNASTRGLENVPHHGGVIVAGNHPSLMDGVLLFCALPRAVRFIVNTDLAEHPILHRIAESMGYLPIHHHTLHAAEEALSQGDVLGLFPEGWSWDTAVIREWKPGAAILALKSGLPVVPLGIAGTDVAWPGATLMPRPLPVALSFGKPLTFRRVDAEEVPASDMEATLGAIRDAVHGEVSNAHAMLVGASPSPLWRIGLAAIFLLPMVAVFTLTTPGVDNPSG